MSFLPTIVLIVAVSALVLSLVFSLVYARRSRIAAAISTLLVLPFVGFFVFGFFSSFELAEGTTATTWKVSYAILSAGAVCIFLWSVYCLVHPGRKTNEPSS